MLLSLQFLHSQFLRAESFTTKMGLISEEKLTTVAVFVEVSRPKRQKSFCAVAYDLFFLKNKY